MHNKCKNLYTYIVFVLVMKLPAVCSARNYIYVHTYIAIRVFVFFQQNSSINTNGKTNNNILVTNILPDNVRTLALPKNCK